MPMPRWLAQVNKHTFNKKELRGDRWPALTHVGRSSGTVYRTPLEAHPVNGGYIFILNYGSGSDWVKNVLAAGSASLRIDGNDVALVSPRLLTEDVAWELLPAGTKRPPKLARVTEFLQMDVTQ